MAHQMAYHKSQTTKKPMNFMGFFALLGGDGGIRTLDAGFARMLP
jgi:hypothetical protein